MAGDASKTTAADAQAMALRYLSRREYACAELTRKLQQRGIAADLAEQVVGDLAEQNLISDERFAKALVRGRVRKGFGPLRIRADLRQKGVPDALIAESLGAFDKAWYDEALAWTRRKHRGDLDEKARARLYRSGTNRGFSHDHVMRADRCAAPRGDRTGLTQLRLHRAINPGCLLAPNEYLRWVDLRTRRLYLFTLTAAVMRTP